MRERMRATEDAVAKVGGGGVGVILMAMLKTCCLRWRWLKQLDLLKGSDWNCRNEY